MVVLAPAVSLTLEAVFLCPRNFSNLPSKLFKIRSLSAPLQGGGG